MIQIITDSQNQMMITTSNFRSNPGTTSKGVAKKINQSKSFSMNSLTLKLKLNPFKKIQQSLAIEVARTGPECRHKLPLKLKQTISFKIYVTLSATTKVLKHTAFSTRSN